jgi:hypothetical protein
MQVTCIKCTKHGTLSINQSKSNGRVYKYYGIQHYDPETKKRSWCYIGKYESLPKQYKMVIHKKQSLHTNYTQTSRNSEKLDSSFFTENKVEKLVARRRFELLSWGPKPHMPSQRVLLFDRYTTGLIDNGIKRSIFYRLCIDGRTD